MTRLKILKGKLTQNVHHRETVIERQTNEESTHGKLPECGGKCRDHACYEAREIRPDQGRNAAIMIGHPTEH